ncbi:MAG: UPF0175 family protein [Leptospiraceae bacterium]|nr:UPF0175 family protein [Leptospiraceae bacterium]MCP5500330.1 UPF0175 family protein [Leptospiraceae bacterium]
MQVSIDFKDPFFTFYDSSSLISDIQLSLSLMLYKQGKISITKASHIANMDIYRFMQECSNNKVPVINISEEDMKKEWESLKKDFL